MGQIDYPADPWATLTPAGYTSTKKKKPLTLSPLKQEDWDKINPKGRWDSIVALRGPDLRDSETLKYYTTSVIRHRLSEVMRVGGMINSQTPFVVVTGEQLTDKTPFSISHFTGHILEASAWLNIPRLVVPASVYLKFTTGIHRYTGAQLVYQFADKDQKSILAAILSGAGMPIPQDGAPNVG